MTDDNGWRRRMRERNPEALRALNRRYYHSPAGQAAKQRGFQRKRDIVTAEREARGNVCLDCGGDGYEGQLYWHHRDPDERSFHIGSSIIKSYAAVYAELAKCDLLCEDCHARRHCLPLPSRRRAEKEASRGVSRAS